MAWIALAFPEIDLPTSNALTSVLSIALVAFAVSFLVLKPRDGLTRGLAQLVVISAIAAQVRGLAGVAGDPARLVYFAAIGLVPAAFLTFCSRLIQTYGPDDEPAAALRGRLFNIASRVALITATLDIVSLFFVPDLMPVTRPLLLGTQIAAQGIGYVFLARHCLRLRSSSSHNALMVIAAGLALAYTPALAFNSLPLTFGGHSLLPNPVATAFQFALPLAFAFATIRWRAGSLVALVDRISVYFLLGLGLALAYVAVAYLVERSVDTRASLLPQFVSLLFAGVAAVTYAPLRARLQRLLDMRLFRDHYNYEQTLQRFSSDLATLRTQDEVASLLLDGISQTLNTQGIAYVALPEGLDQHILTLLDDGDLHTRGSFSTPDGRMSVLLGLAALGVNPPLSAAAPLLADPWPGCMALILISSPISEEGVGLLVLGGKRTSAGLRRSDRTFLITLAHHAGTALANAVLVDGLRTSLMQVQISTNQLAAARAEQELLLRELVNADERQRATLAEELHDVALQEVLYLVRHSRFAQQLADSLQRSRAADAEQLASVQAAELAHVRALFARLLLELGYLVDRSVIAENAIRALCLGLYPALLSDLGLAAALDDLALDLSAATEMAVRVNYSNEAAEAAKMLSPEVALHAYRIVQEAVRNAAKHADCAEVAVTLTHEQRRAGLGPSSRDGAALCIVVQDRGPGLALPIDFGEFLRRGHLGLAGMRERAARTGGDIEFGCGLDGGTRIALRVPIEQRAKTPLAVEAREARMEGAAS